MILKGGNEGGMVIIVGMSVNDAVLYERDVHWK
jgi:hypothetical protein